MNLIIKKVQHAMKISQSFIRWPVELEPPVGIVVIKPQERFGVFLRMFNYFVSVAKGQTVIAVVSGTKLLQ